MPSPAAQVVMAAAAGARAAVVIDQELLFTDSYGGQGSAGPRTGTTPRSAEDL
jgi:hypothetical protein